MRSPCDQESLASNDLSAIKRDKPILIAESLAVPESVVKIASELAMRDFGVLTL